ncbi:MAG: deoxyribonuclease IV [Deferribacterales bacterium]
MIIGAHESIAGGLYKSIERGALDKTESLQIFVKSSNRWKDKPLTEKDIANFFEYSKKYSIPPNRIVAHSSYLINMASDGEVYEKSFESMEDELKRCDLLEIPYYVIHPGSHLGIGENEGLNKVVSFIDTLYSKNNFNTMTLLEITAGQGTNLGYKIEHLTYIIDKTKFTDKLGVCLDTCHMYSAGYDILDNYEVVMNNILSIFGDMVKVIHINDTKKPLGSRVDRHELIGKGLFGIEFFKRLVNDTKLDGILGILETPVVDNYSAEIELLKSLKRYN